MVTYLGEEGSVGVRGQQRVWEGGSSVNEATTMILHRTYIIMSKHVLACLILCCF